MADFGLLYPLWFHAAEPGALDEWLGSVGVQFVTLPLVTGPLRDFRTPRAAGPPPEFASEGGWQYPPDHSLYASAGVRPHAARWTAKRDHLRAVAETLRERGVRLVARLDLSHVAHLCEHATHVQQCSAWGDDGVPRPACPLNPTLQLLAQECLADLGRYGPAEIEWDHIETKPASRGETAGVSALLDICFCSACRALADQAGIDADAVARSVRVHAERAFGKAQPESALRAAVGDELLTRYRALRCASVEQWLTRVAEKHPALRFWSIRRPAHERVATQRSATSRDAESGSLFGAPSSTARNSLSAPGVAAPASAERDAASAPGVATSARGAAVPSRVGTILDISYDLPASETLVEADAVPEALLTRAWVPAFGSSAALVRATGDAVRLGTRRITFADLYACPPDVTNWIKQAVRWSRREAGDPSGA